jgi:hypothetical protein
MKSRKNKRSTTLAPGHHLALAAASVYVDNNKRQRHNEKLTSLDLTNNEMTKPSTTYCLSLSKFMNFIALCEDEKQVLRLLITTQELAFYTYTLALERMRRIKVQLDVVEAMAI